MSDKKENPMFSAGEKYDRQTGAWSQLLAPGFVEFMQIREGDSVLDVGCGTGILTLTISRNTKASKIVGIDQSAGFIKYASEKRSDARVSYKQGDAQSLPSSDASFDRSMAMLVIGFIPDASKAVRELKRVTKPGGSVGAVWWDTVGRMDHNRSLWEAAIAVDPSADSVSPGKYIAYGSAEGISACWTDAGLRDVDVRGLVVEREFASLDDYWLPLVTAQGVAGTYLGSLSPELQAAIRERLRQNLLGDRADGPFSLQAKAWAVKGTVP